jgi:hypothetical protein
MYKSYSRLPVAVLMAAVSLPTIGCRANDGRGLNPTSAVDAAPRPVEDEDTTPDPGPTPPSPVDGGDTTPNPADAGSDPALAFTCCINDAFYGCATNEAFVRCTGGVDIEGCAAACAPGDFGCVDACFMMLESASPDPSQCVRDAARDGTCEGSGSSTCVDEPTGARCDYDSDCDTNNCVDAQCYLNTTGSRCEYDSNCNSGNCTDGCCQERTSDASCEYDSDCDSNNCYQGRCEGNGPGSGCDYDSDCASTNCVANRCE